MTRKRYYGYKPPNEHYDEVSYESHQNQFNFTNLIYYE